MLSAQFLGYICLLIQIVCSCKHTYGFSGSLIGQLNIRMAKMPDLSDSECGESVSTRRGAHGISDTAALLGIVIRLVNGISLAKTSF